MKSATGLARRLRVKFTTLGGKLFRANGLEAFFFSVKAAVAAVIAFELLRRADASAALWGAVSAVIVLQPGLHPSMRAALYRCAANLIGAITGALLVSLLGSTPLSLALGVLLTGLICHYTHLDDAVRPAFASVVIVMLKLDGSIWHGSLDRMIAVVVGCGVALAMTLLFDWTYSSLGRFGKGNADAE